MKRYSVKIIFYCFFFLFYSNVYGQALNRNQTISAYIYNFSKNLTWKNESEFETFNIVLVSDDVALKNELEKVLKTAKIKGKSAIVSLESYPERISKTVQIVYISENKFSLYYDLFDKVEKKPILIISENLQDKKYAMINLYDAPNRKMLFEINKANVLNQGITISDELLLMGGTLIDVAEMYRNSQTSLRDIEKKLVKNEAKLDSINKLYTKFQEEIVRQEKLIEDQKLLVETKKKTIENQKLELEEQLKRSTEQNFLIKKQALVLYSIRDSLKIQQRRLKNSEISLKRQAQELIKGNLELVKQQNEISKMDVILVEKTDELGRQSITISKQRQILWLFSFVIALVVFIVIFIFIALRNNKRKNKLLNEHKIKIEEINQELQSSIEEIQSTNEELHNKNEELVITLTKLKEAQDNLLQAEKMASLGVLTAGIAHEMNNPINFVYAGVNSLKKDFVDILPILDEIEKLNSTDDNLTEKIKEIENLKEQNDYSIALDAIKQTIDDIKLGADRTAEIVKGLKNFSRIDKEDWYSANIHESIDDALVLLKNKYKMTIDIIKNYDENIPNVECFPGKLNQVFVNIIGNAIDSIEKKGAISITTALSRQYVNISIKDNGHGISPEIKAKIFDPFFTTKKIGKGQGLGLAITYGIIKEHKGVVDVKSEIGKGTEFIIQLPLKQNNI